MSEPRAAGKLPAGDSRSGVTARHDALVSLDHEKAVDSPVTEVPLKSRPKEWWLSVLAAVVFFGLAVAAILLRRAIVNFRTYGYAGAFFVSFLAGSTVVLYIPGVPAIFAFGAVLNPLLVGVVAGFGESLGELTSYLFGRGGKGFIHRQVEGRFARLYLPIKNWVRKRGMLVIFLAAAILNPFYDMFGIAAGAMGMPAWRFFVACTAGKIVKNTAIAFLGFWGLSFVLRWLGVSG